MPDGEFRSAVPVIATDDVAASVEYFVRTLGFEPDFTWGDPPVYAGVKAGNVEIYLTHDPATANAIRERNLTPDLFLWVTGIDGMYARHCAQGLTSSKHSATDPGTSASTSSASRMVIILKSLRRCTETASKKCCRPR
jgi:hypothetical protein